MATVGSLGDITFNVSSRRVLTFDNYSRQGNAKTAEHEIIGEKSNMEYTGLEPDEISFDIELFSQLNVTPETQHGAGLMLLTVLVLASWCINAWQTGKADTNTLISFFREYTAPAVVAAVTFLSVFFVDKNGDGRPDAAERESENERYRRF